MMARDAAQSYIRRGWKPIPVGYRSKRPKPYDLNNQETLLEVRVGGGGDLGRDRGNGGGRGAGDHGADHGDGVGRSGDADGGRRSGRVGGDLGDDDSCGGGDDCGGDGGGPGRGGRDRVDGGGGGRSRYRGPGGGGHHCHGSGSGGRASGRDGAGPGDDFGGGGGDSRRRDGGGGGLGRSGGDAVGRDGGRGGGGRGGHGGADAAAQTIFPGSVHESGEDIKWARDGEPARIDAPPYTPDEFLKFVTDVTSMPGALDPTAIAALEGLPERLHVRDKASITTSAGVEAYHVG
jgi:hypothetical protein